MIITSVWRSIWTNGEAIGSLRCTMCTMMEEGTTRADLHSIHSTTAPD